MKRQLQNDASSSDESGNTNVLADWITTVATFHNHYDRIASLVTAYHLQQPFINHGARLGQCSVEELTNLMDRMEHELARLLMDMKQSTQTTMAQNYPKLVAHTRVLNALNQEAQKLLALAAS